VRIEGFRVKNFRGLRRAEIDSIADAPVVTVSGPNGAGKSLLFEALMFVWRASLRWPTQRYDLNPLIGPWSNETEIGVTFRLTSDESDALSSFRQRNSGGEAADPPDLVTLKTVVKHGDPIGELSTVADEWGHILWSPRFAERHAFAHVDYLPADRGIQRGEQAQVNPALLGRQQTESLRDQVVNTFVQQRQILTLTGVQPFLASLDYVDMLAERERGELTGDFQSISDAFFQATGKRIHRPRLDPRVPFGAVLEVETPSGEEHNIDQLSSGEQEVLTLMFYVRRLSSSGGLLLIDEPELHLHPALQQSLFSVLESVADRAQICIVTHSPKLVTAALLDAVIHMTPTAGEDSNQVSKAADEEARGELLSDLGVHPIDVLQSDMLVVVEGSLDARRLPAALPLTLSRSALHIAGDAKGVEATCRTLASRTLLIPWICIRDRDLLSDEDVANLHAKMPGLFVWPSRCLENELLSPSLVSVTLQRTGRTTTEEEVVAKLLSLADAHRESILAGWTDLELKRRHPISLRSNSGGLDRELAYLEAAEAGAKDKIAVFADIRDQMAQDLDTRWDEEWFKLMDGKRALGEFLSETPYQNVADFVNALTHTLRESAAPLPPGLQTLQERLVALRGEPVTASNTAS
jgi:hypothetical protein